MQYGANQFSSASQQKPKCLDVESWRAFTPEEMKAHLEKMQERAQVRMHGGAGVSDGSMAQTEPSVLAVRQRLSPVDIYCYLRGRFGEPNGFQNVLRRDSSDNWIHWDFNLKADNVDVYICGTYREVHFIVWERLSDEDWRDLIVKVKADYRRVATQKALVMDSLEKWVVFANKFVQIAGVCSSLHAEIKRHIGGFESYKFSSAKNLAQQKEVLGRLSRRSSRLYRSCLELSLITPVLAEAFINMAILILCKKEVRDPTVRNQVWQVIEDPYPGFDLSRRITGGLLPPHVAEGFLQGIRFDDELPVNWPE